MDPETEREIRKRIEKRIEERNGYYIHVVAFVLVNAFLWMIYLMTMPGEFMWPLIPLFGWGIGFFFHTLDYYYKYGAGRERQERYIQQEIQRERELLYGGSLPKRKNDEELFIYDDEEESLTDRR